MAATPEELHAERKESPTSYLFGFVHSSGTPYVVVKETDAILEQTTLHICRINSGEEIGNIKGSWKTTRSGLVKFRADVLFNNKHGSDDPTARELIRETIVHAVAGGFVGVWDSTRDLNKQSLHTYRSIKADSQLKGILSVRETHRPSDFFEPRFFIAQDPAFARRRR